MNNPPCFTPKCVTCPVKDSCSAYKEPVIPHTPYAPWSPWQPPYVVSSPPPWDNTTWTDDTISSSMKLAVY